MSFDSSFYATAARLILMGEPPLQALQIAARRRGLIMALPEPVAAYLAACTTAEALALVERAGDAAAERERAAEA